MQITPNFFNPVKITPGFTSEPVSVPRNTEAPVSSDSVSISAGAPPPEKKPEIQVAYEKPASPPALEMPEKKPAAVPATIPSYSGIFMEEPVLFGIASAPAQAPISGTEAAKDGTFKTLGAEAQRMFDGMKESEKKITPQLAEMASALGTKLDGLEYSVKTASSLERKILKKLVDTPHLNAAQMLSRIGDAVRYTQITSHDEIAPTTTKTIDYLKSHGYQVVEVENKYTDETSNYKGVHLGVISPDGQKFEMQIHSPESMAVKNKIHPLYEEYRVLDSEDPKAQQLAEQIGSISATLPMPKGIEALESFKL